MRELLYAIPGGRPGQGLEWGLTPAHMSYRVGPGPRLVGVGLTPEVRGGAMMVSCAGDPGGRRLPPVLPPGGGGMPPPWI